MAELKGQQKEFADYLLQDPEQNATAAYRKAYPGCKTDNGAYVSASKLLSSAKVDDYLTKARAERAERTRINADWLLKRLADESEADIADLYDEATGALLPVHKWPKVFRTGLVAGMDVTALGDDIKVTKIKLSDRAARLKMIGDHIGVGAFKQIVQLGGDPANPLQVQTTINVTGLSSAALEELANLRTK